MLNNFNFRHATILLLLISTLTVLSLPLVAQGQTQGIERNPLVDGFYRAGDTAGFPNSDGQGPPTRTLNVALITYANGFIGLFGAFFLILAIYAGWLWMSARGNEQQVEKAKHMLLNTTIALAIMLGALMIVQLTLSVVGPAATSSDISNL